VKLSGLDVNGAAPAGICRDFLVFAGLAIAVQERNEPARVDELKNAMVRVSISN
jgi:hypothetical protein